MKIVWLSQYNIFKLLPEINLRLKVILHNSSWIQNLSDELALNKEIELHIISYSHLIDQSQEFMKNGIYFHIIKYNFPFTNKGFPWYLPLDKLNAYNTFKKVAEKVIKEIKPDVLHVHGTEGGYFLPAIEINIPTIISIQGIIKECVREQPSVSGYMQIPYERFALKKGVNFGCRTEFDSGHVRKINKNARIFDLPEAINKIYFEKEWNPQKGISLVFVGTVIKRKGIEDLISSLCIVKNDFPEIKLKIIGSGTTKYHIKLQKMIKEKSLSSNVIWLGNRSPEEIALELSISNIFVLPTLIDNSPNSLAEAMALGIPSIATNVGGIPSMITDKYDGMLFERNDVNMLAKIIKELIVDKSLQKKLSSNAQKRVFERNYPSKVAIKYVEIYKTLLQ